MFLRYGALLLGLLLASSCEAQTMLDKYQSGVHYFPIEPAQPLSSTPGKVEVVEVFSYACSHCATFEPAVEAWRGRMPARATFTALPAAWNQQWEVFARCYYAAQSLGIADKSHAAFFKALHVQKTPFTNIGDVARWYSSYGVTEDNFVAALQSFEVESKVRRSRELVPQWQVDGTPTVVVAGKYRITGASAGGYDKVFDVVDFLVAKEGVK
jgi:thiol:disulfide interchange protein DsbA